MLISENVSAGFSEQEGIQEKYIVDRVESMPEGTGHESQERGVHFRSFVDVIFEPDSRLMVPRLKDQKGNLTSIIVLGESPISTPWTMTD